MGEGGTVPHVGIDWISNSLGFSTRLFLLNQNIGSVIFGG